VLFLILILLGLVTLVVGLCVMIPVMVMVIDCREAALRRLNGRDTPATRANTRAGGATVPCQSMSLLTRRRKTREQVPQSLLWVSVAKLWRLDTTPTPADDDCDLIDDCERGATIGDHRPYPPMA